MKKIFETIEKLMISMAVFSIFVIKTSDTQIGQMSVQVKVIKTLYFIYECVCGFIRFALAAVTLILALGLLDVSLILGVVVFSISMILMITMLPEDRQEFFSEAREMVQWIRGELPSYLSEKIGR